MATRRDAGKERIWRGAVARQRRSGLSIREFCRREALSEASFYAWRRELALRGAQRIASSGRTPPATFARIDVTPAAASLAHSHEGRYAAALEIVLADGVRIRVAPGASRQLLAEVLAALEVSTREARAC